VLTVSGYDIDGVVHAGRDVIVHRGRRIADDLPVLIKHPRSESPSLRVLDRLRREHAVVATLDDDRIGHALALVACDHGLALVLEDLSCTTLRATCDRAPVSNAEFIDLALAITDAIAAVHRNGFAHRNIRPETILVDADGRISLTEFHAAGPIGSEAVAETSRDLSFTYIAPEQTDRLNRPVDQRSDFYLLGLIFFELLTGRPPFVHEDQLELVHLHISKKPPPLSSFQPAVAPGLELLVLKLLAKASDERYQSAQGLRSDLVRCREALASTETIAPFTLGTDDPPPRLTFAERIYGSEGLIHDFLGAFERATKGSRELVLIHGAAGAGKSQLLHELLHSHIAGRGQLLLGSCPNDPPSPYASLLGPLRVRLQEILNSSAAELEIWRMQIAAAVGTGAELLGGYLPEISTLLSVPSSPPASHEGEGEVSQRFQTLFDALLRAMAMAQTPFVIVLDDLQAIDPSSALALSRFFEDPRGHALMLVGVYRGDAVGRAHPIRHLATSAAQGGATVTEQALSSLSAGDTVALLRDCLTPSDNPLRSLGDALYNRTGGNPRFTRLLLETLHEHRRVRYDRDTKKWSWDVTEEDLDTDLPTILERRLKSTPESTQRALAIAASIGSRFSLDLLASLSEDNVAELSQSLAPAFRLGILRETRAPSSPSLVYAFTDEHLITVALRSLDEDPRRAYQRRIGTLLLEMGAAADERIFSVEDHFTRGLEDGADTQALAELARLSHEAGTRAMVTGAYTTAAAYLERGVELMPTSAWKEEHPLMLKLYMGLADARLLLGDFKAASVLFDRALREIRSPLNRAEFLAFKISREITLRRFEDALATGRAGLSLLGVKVPTQGSRASLTIEHTRIRWQLRKRTPRCFLDLPQSLERRTYLIHSLLMNMAPAALFRDFRLAAVILLRLANLTLERGRTDISAFGVAGYGLLLATLHGEYAQAMELAEVADAMLALHPSPAIEPKVDLITGLFIQPWVGTLHDAKGRLEHGHERALLRGDATYANFCGSQVPPLSFFAGDDLARVLDHTSTYDAHLRQSGATSGHSIVKALEVLCMSLRGQGDAQADNDHEQGQALLEKIAQLPKNQSALYIPLYRGIALFHAGDHVQAQIFFDAAAQVSTPIVFVASRADLEYFSALNLCELAMQAAPHERRTYTGRVATHYDELEAWAALNPTSFGARAETVAAALAWALDRTHEVMPHLNTALKLASEAADPHREGIAAEIAARVAIATETTFLLDHYLDLAFDAYQRYGAQAKLTILSATYGERNPNQESRSRVPAETSTLVPVDGSGGKSLDVGTVIKATQALSGEIVLDRLLDTLIQVVMENAGARRCFLVLVHQGRLLVEAEGSVDAEQIEVLGSTPIEEHDDLPHSILKYVIRSGSSVVLDDAAERGAFTKDVFVRREALKSVLCMPIIHHNKVMGALNLENNLATEVFTGDRLELLNQLAAQLAISVDNARLYESLDHARENAVSADQAKTRFLMNMSHELRTPLNAIIGYTELIEEDLMDGVSDGFVDDIGSIQTAALRLERTLESALELSRIEAGTFTIELEDVDVNELVRDVLRELAPSLSERGNQLDLEVAQVGLIISDRLRLRYCLRSILDNAIRFTEGGRVKLKIEVHAENDPPQLAIEVSDNGIGISPEHTQRIFDAFTQADDSTTRSYEGSGVSLAVTKQISVSLGGSIKLESTVGVGSRFMINLPLRRPTPRT